MKLWNNQKQNELFQPKKYGDHLCHIKNLSHSKIHNQKAQFENNASAYYILDGWAYKRFCAILLRVSLATQFFLFMVRPTSLRWRDSTELSMIEATNIINQ